MTKQIHKIYLWEDHIVLNEAGEVTHHPLNSRYFWVPGKDISSYGLLTFGGDMLDKSPLLQNVRVFYLEFPSELLKRRGRRADKLRAQILERLSSEDRAWYLSFIGDVENGSDPTGYVSIDSDIERRFSEEFRLGREVVQSEDANRIGKFVPRTFFEVPNKLLAPVVTAYWGRAYPGNAIQGYNMPTGQIDQFREWNSRARDDVLFREIIDYTFVNFYTYPAENQHFVFITNKLRLEDIERMLDL